MAVISTNAGGTAVLRYGNMRELVMGIEAVMPDGTLFTPPQQTDRKTIPVII